MFCCCGDRSGKKLTPVNLSMSLMGVSENLSSLDKGEGSCREVSVQREGGGWVGGGGKEYL